MPTYDGHYISEAGALRRDMQARISALEAELAAEKERQADAERIAKLEAENAELKAVAHTEARNWTLTANRLIAARQSRARLVGAVREQRELLKAARLIRAELRQEVAGLTTEADAARAWSAAWREAAHVWRGRYDAICVITPGRLGISSRRRRNARRAAEAAEAQERR